MAFPKKDKVVEPASKISKTFIKDHPGSKKNPQGPDFYSTKFGRKGKQGDIAVKQVGDKWRTNLNVPVLKPFLPKFFDKRDDALVWLDKVHTLSLKDTNFQHEQIGELELEWSFKVPKSEQKAKVLDLAKITQTFELDRKGGFPMAKKKKTEEEVETKKTKKEKKVKPKKEKKAKKEKKVKPKKEKKAKKEKKKKEKKGKKKNKKEKKSKKSKKEKKAKADPKVLSKIKNKIKEAKASIKGEKIAYKAAVKAIKATVKNLKKELKQAKKGK